MKLITTCAIFPIGIGIGLVSFSLSAVLRIRYKQASHRVLSHVFHHAHQAIKLEASRLDKKQFSRVIQDYLGIASTKILVVREDKCEKNFTHNELFTLQKRFLDNFITSNNAYQMVHLVPHLAPKDFPNEDRKTENLRWERKSGLICSNESKTWNTIQSSIHT